MNRSDFQKLAKQRLREAQTLFAARLYSGCYYLAGLSVECALKSRISKQTRRHEFPDKTRANEAWRHKLELLLKLAELEQDLATARRSNPELDTYWLIVKDWNIERRYDPSITRTQASNMLEAVADPDKGVLPWLQDRW